MKIPSNSCNRDALLDFTHYNLSTSAQFNLEQLQYMVQMLKDQHGIAAHQIYIVDLREEPHLYINNMSVSLGVLGTHHDTQKFDYCKGYSSEQLLEIEQENQSRILQHTCHPLYIAINKRALESEKRYKASYFTVDVVHTEKKLVETLGAQYRRFPITDHQHPSHKTLTELVEFIESLPHDAWIHFHCRGGKGRSGSAVFIYDVIKNKHAYPLSVILERTKQFGIAKSIFTPNPKKPEKLQHAQNRKKFLETFYNQYAATKKS